MKSQEPTWKLRHVVIGALVLLAGYLFVINQGATPWVILKIPNGADPELLFKLNLYEPFQRDTLLDREEREKLLPTLEERQHVSDFDKRSGTSTEEFSAKAGRVRALDSWPSPEEPMSQWTEVFPSSLSIRDLINEGMTGIIRFHGANGIYSSNQKTEHGKSCCIAKAIR